MFEPDKDQERSISAFFHAMEHDFDYFEDTEITLDDELGQIHGRIADNVGPRMPGRHRW